ncbi:MAG: hypothetical protein WC080_04585, partial [Patescibacteria group bacterium]
MNVQKSTRTTFSRFSPWHNALRMKSRWYYRWHLNNIASPIHWGILVLYVAIVASFGFMIVRPSDIINPKSARAADSYSMAGLVEHSAYNGTWVDSGNTYNSSPYYENGSLYVFRMEWGNWYAGSSLGDTSVLIGPSSASPDGSYTYMSETGVLSLVPSTITISGTCKQYDEATNCSDGETIKIAVNGTIQTQTGTTTSGTWSVADVPTNSGDMITAFVHNVPDANEANAVTKYDGTGDITGINLYEKHLSIGSDDNQTISNADLSNYDSSVSQNEDIFFDVDASNNLTLPATGT